MIERSQPSDARLVADNRSGVHNADAMKAPVGANLERDGVLQRRIRLAHVSERNLDKRIERLDLTSMRTTHVAIKALVVVDSERQQSAAAVNWREALVEADEPCALHSIHFVGQQIPGSALVAAESFRVHVDSCAGMFS